ncbi:Xanthotoxin 5-hydroxylase CYP82C4 [Linum perenne]
MADQYGPAFTIRLGRLNCYVVSSADVAKECFTTSDKALGSRPRSTATKHMCYNDSVFGFAPTTPHWREMRKIVVLELLSNRRLELLTKVVSSELDAAILNLYDLCGSGGVSAAVVQLDEWFENFTYNVVARVVAGRRNGGESREAERCKRAVGEFFRLMGMFVVGDAIPWLGWMDFQGHVKDMKKTAKEMDSVFGGWVDEHRKSKLSGQVKTEDEQDFIDLMLCFEEEGRFSGFPCDSDTNIRATCVSLISGGTDTSSLTMTWAISLLLNSPSVLKRAQEEIDVQVGHHRKVNESDIKNLTYIQAIVKETLRLYPVAPLSGPREALEDCTVGGYHVPKGTRVIINAWKIQRDPKVWPNPLEFQPERFLTATHGHIDVKGQNFELLPFGSGRRVCPGASLSMQTLNLTIARLLQAFHLQKPGGQQIDMTEKAGVNLPKATPLQVVLSPRMDVKILRSKLPAKGKKVPEAGRSWPVIGHLFSLLGTELPHIKFAALADRYGPIFIIRIGQYPTLVVSTSELAKELYTTHDVAVSSRPNYTASRILSNNGADMGFSPYGEYWRQMRKITAMELLSNRRLGLLKQVRTSEVDAGIRDLYRVWEKENKSGQVSVELKKWFGDINLNVILRMVAGKRYFGGANDGDRETERCKKLMREFFQYAGQLVVRDVFPFLGFLDIGGYEKTMKKLNHDLNHLAEEWIEEHRNGTHSHEHQDFIDVLLSVLKEVDLAGYDLDTVCKSTIMTLIVGGTDTTTVTLIWALSLILNHPSTLKRAQEELDAIVGKNRMVDESDIDKLVYLQCIMKEVMRLYPAGPIGGPREFSKDCNVGGYHVPAGTRLIVNLYKLQRDPEVWSEPMEFKPERFLTKQYKDVDMKGQDFELIPFGAGRRSCPGINFGIQITQLLLASFLQAFEISTPSGAPVDMSAVSGLTVSKATPLEVLVKPRLPATLYH